MKPSVKLRVWRGVTDGDLRSDRVLGGGLLVETYGQIVCSVGRLAQSVSFGHRWDDRGK